MIKVFIDGKEGTTGLKIFDRIKDREDLVLLEIKEELRKDINERKRLINLSDVTFLCLPDSASIESVSLLENNKTKIIDASTAHRTNEDWAYGFPELGNDFLEKIIKSNKVCVPGCHASGVLSILYPLIKEEIINKDHFINVTSLTGYSGGGKKMINEYENIQNNELLSPRIYGLTQTHKHLKEIKKVCSLKYNPIFIPIVSNYYNGMVVSIGFDNMSLNKKMTLDNLYNFYSEYYKNKKIIKILNLNNVEDNMYFSSNKYQNKDTMEIVIAGNDERFLILSRFDNLGKGASGAAIQLMNIMFNINEEKGLNI